MKSKSHRQPFYFSAYPLKAITGNSGNSSTESPYLKAVLAGSKTKTIDKVRVFPMVNPYKATSSKPVTPAKDVEVSGDEWFNHYE